MPTKTKSISLEKDAPEKTIAAETTPADLPAKPLSPGIPKYRQIYEDLYSAILSGQLRPGDKLPSEAELTARYSTSRITVAKAVNDMQLQGLVSRKAGSGTRVLAPALTTGRVFGLLIPDLGRTEIFEPICHGMMQSSLSKPHSLLWGHSSGDVSLQEKEAIHLCQQYISQKVSGIFFAPLEFTPAKDAVNQKIVAALERVGIPIILLDRCFMPYTTRSRHDLIGIDNRLTGYLITNHLLNQGARRLLFVARPHSANTVTARIAGFHEALIAHGIPVNSCLVRRGDPEDASYLKKIIAEDRPDGIVCANDFMAAHVMTGLSDLSVRIPDEIRIVGIDDVKYAAHLPVPLTTQHQNCTEIGEAAIATMLQRLDYPQMPTRDILIKTRTVVRKSCGAHHDYQASAD